MRRSTRISLCALALALPAAPPAAAQSDAGLLSIAPGRRAVVTRPPATLGPLQVTNTTRQSFRVDVYAVPLGQDLNGNLTFARTRAAERDARRWVSVTPRRLRMAPNARREIRMRWKRVTEGLKTTSVAVIVQGTPVGKTKGLGSVLRLVNANFLRAPGPARAGGRFVGLTAEQAPQAGVLQFTPTFENTGQSYERPRGGVLEIRDGSGAVVLRRRISSDVVIPGYRRAVKVLVKDKFPAGSYTATARIRLGAAQPLTTATPFRLVATNELPTKRVRLGKVSATGYAGEAAKTSVELTNDGNQPVRVRLGLTLRHSRNGVVRGGVLATKQLTTDTLAPGKRMTVEVEAGKLDKAETTIGVAASIEGRRMGEGSAVVVPATKPSIGRRISDFASDNAIALIVVAFVLGAGLIGVVAFRLGGRTRLRD